MGLGTPHRHPQGTTSPQWAAKSNRNIKMIFVEFPYFLPTIWRKGVHALMKMLFATWWERGLRNEWLPLSLVFMLIAVYIKKQPKMVCPLWHKQLPKRTMVLLLIPEAVQWNLIVTCSSIIKTVTQLSELILKPYLVNLGQHMIRKETKWHVMW